MLLLTRTMVQTNVGKKYKIETSEKNKNEILIIMRREQKRRKGFEKHSRACIWQCFNCKIWLMNMTGFGELKSTNCLQS